MDLSVVSIIMSSITTIVVVVAPVITTIITCNTNKRLKQFELHAPRIYDALSEMAVAYSRLIRENPAEEDRLALEVKVVSTFYDFAGVCYRVMSLIPKKDIQAKITELMAELRTGGYIPGINSDALFNQLMADITDYLRKSKKY